MRQITQSAIQFDTSHDNHMTVYLFSSKCNSRSCITCIKECSCKDFILFLSKTSSVSLFKPSSPSIRLISLPAIKIHKSERKLSKYLPCRKRALKEGSLCNCSNGNTLIPLYAK